MKRKAIYILLLCGLLFQCAHQKEQIGQSVSPEMEKTCLSIFPPKPFRAVHKIEADLPFGGYETFIGVTEVHPDTGAIKIFLLSPEGVTLLDAECTGTETTINSGIPPLDGKEFVNGFADGIRFLFMAPDGPAEKTSTGKDGSCLCAWTKGGLRTEIVNTGTGAVIREMKGRSKIVRQAELTGKAGCGLYSKMTLHSGGLSGYTLSFELVQAEGAGG